MPSKIFILKHIPFEGNIIDYDLYSLIKAPQGDPIIKKIISDLIRHKLINCEEGEGFMGGVKMYNLTSKGKKTIFPQWCESCECVPCDCDWGLNE